ncbi:hypothetical protein ACIFOC_00071 [Leucobacter aridicollis]
MASGDVVCPDYCHNMARSSRYSDAELATAIAKARSWRGVLRNLGLLDSSSGAIRHARARADDLALGYAHFSGQRGWTEAQLRSAVRASHSWDEVSKKLGLNESASAYTLPGHAARLRIDSRHFTERKEANHVSNMRPDISRVDRAGPMVAAAWFTLCGWDVSWPLEPSRFDLLVTRGAETRRIQVKTTTVRVGETWKVYLSTSRGQRKAYEPSEVDDFFVIAGGFDLYMIPLWVAGGLHAIHLSGYQEYRVQGL